MQRLASILAMALAIPPAGTLTAQARGRVVDGDGAPLAGVTVVESSGRRATTGPDGGFEVAVAAGTCVELSARGRATVRVPVARRADLGDVPLLTGAPIVGRVVDTSGAPVADVQVTATDYYFDRPFLHRDADDRLAIHVALALTGTDGRFRIDGALPVGARVVAAPAAGYSYEVGPERAGRPVEIVIDELRDVVGVVTDAHGEAVEDATVYVERAGEWIVDCASGAGGRFRIAVPVGAAHRIAAFVSQGVDHATSRPRDLPERGSVQDVGLRLCGTETAMLEVRATDAATGRPLERFHVGHLVGDPAAMGYRAADVAEALVRRPRASHAGAVSVPRITRAAPVLAEVRAPGRGRRRVEVRDGARELCVALEPEAVVRGRVFDSVHGEPMKGARVAVVAGARPSAREVMPPAESWTRANGAFEIRQLSEGRWCLLIATDGERPIAECEITVRAGEVVDGVVVRVDGGGRIRGRLTGLTPGEGWLVRVRRDALAAEPEQFAGTAPVAADGSFELVGLRREPARLELVLPQPARLGPARPIDLGAVHFDRPPFELDMSRVLRAVRGQLRLMGSPPPRERFAVFLEPEVPPPMRDQLGLRLEGVRSPVAADGSFELLAAIGEHTLLIVDVATGVVFERIDRFCVPADTSALELGELSVRCVRATVRLLGDDGRLEQAERIDVDLGVMFPWGIGRILGGRMVARDGARGVGVDVARGVRELELFLPTSETRLVLKGHRPGQIGPVTLSSAVVDPGERNAIDVPLIVPAAPDG